jgi:hypothetical protein
LRSLPFPSSIRERAEIERIRRAEKRTKKVGGGEAHSREFLNPWWKIKKNKKRKARAQKWASMALSRQRLPSQAAYYGIYY